MAQINYRANLSAKSWPFISTYFGRSVIVGSASRDQNFNRQVQSSEDPDKDVGIPQAYYMHNVMPSSQGFQSIGYTLMIGPIAASGNLCSKIFNLHYAEGSAYLTCLPDGKCYTLQYGTSPQWVKINTLTDISGRAISVVNISGISYVYFSGLGCYKYSPSTNTLDSVTLTGLDPTFVLGIVGAVGYMIAYTSAEVAWSSTIDPTDFVPSLVTGAGGGGVELARGPITYCVSNSLGFVVYTEFNAVVAIYSNNSRYPFTYRTIGAAGGLTSSDVVARDISDSAHYAYTTAGLQSIASNGAAIIYPEVTDFLSGKLFEDFDATTNTFSQQQVITLKKLLNIVANRYLVISYGVAELTHALVLDLAMKRWGKLKVTHTDVVEFLIYPAEQTEIPRQSLGFFSKTGAIVKVDFDSNDIDTLHDGVLIAGKYQYVRARLVTLEEVTIENVRDVTKFSLHDMVSLDGKLVSSVVPGALKSVAGQSLTYNFHAPGTNHSLLFKGSFFATSLELTFSSQGHR